MSEGGGLCAAVPGQGHRPFGLRRFNLVCASKVRIRQEGEVVLRSPARFRILLTGEL